MIRAVAARGAQAAATFLAASLLLFAVTEFSPGSVAARILGPYALGSQVALPSDRLGLGDPPPARYLRWLGTLMGPVPERLGDPASELGLSDPHGKRHLGDLGFSLMQREPVMDVLAAWSVGIAAPPALLLGALAGPRPGSRIDRAISTVTVTPTSLPEFVVAVLLLALFSARLGWFPGAATLDPGDRRSVAARMALPVAVLLLASGAHLARITRASVADVMGRDFVRTARLEGLPPACSSATPCSRRWWRR